MEKLCDRLIATLTQANHLSDINAVVNETRYTLQVRAIRVNYMVGDITEAVYRSDIQRMDKAHSKRIENAQICDMYGNACRDILTRFGGNQSETTIPEQLLIEEATQTLREVEELRAYTNKSIVDLGKWYGHRSNTNTIRAV